MNGKFTVTRFGKTLGEVTLTEKGLTVETEFSGKKPDDDNVYRLAAVCGGKYVLLGVPIPDEDGGLKLKKTYSKTALRDIGFNEPAAFELALPGEKFNAANSHSENLSEPEANLEPKPQTKSEPEFKPEPKPQTKPEPEFKPELKPQVKPEIEFKPEPKPQAKLEPEFKPEPKPQAKLEPELKPEPKPQAKTEPELKSEPNLQAKPELEQKFELVTEKAPVKRTKWRAVDNPTVLFSDNGALSSADEITGALLREEGDTAYLAVPISDSKSFPLMAVFCLGEAETIDGGDYLVFKLKNGVFSA